VGVAKVSRVRAWAVVVGICSLLASVAGPSPQASMQGTAPQAGQPAPALEIGPADRDVQIREGLVVGLLGTLARNAVPSDLLAWKLATGAFTEPREGDVIGPDDRNRTQTWARAQAGADGWIQNRALNGGYFFTTIVADRPRTMIMDASSYYVARLNGEPRGGEKYGTEWVRHPVRLQKGRNTLLIQGERGRLRVRLFDPPAPLFLTDVDSTLPDLLPGETGQWWAGVRLVNATSETISGIEIAYAFEGQARVAALDSTIPPLMTRKLAIPLLLRAPDRAGPVTVSLRVRARAGVKSVEAPAFDLALKAVEPGAHHVRTFVSEIDGSVQYYGVVPQAPGAAGPAAATATRPALVVSLHGASVEGIGQAKAYKPKDWAVIVAPTNRRPYGFDWEDWGRLDALEVQADAARRFNTDPQRTYLTGHSMGGHGTWQIGATVPGEWAAIAPSAGWRSFSTYGGGATYQNPTSIEQMLLRANNPGETPDLAPNFLHYGVYVLHGDKDDNVPVAQARFMRDLLGKFHPDFAYYERPGGGHWWGDECVDWPPLFEFLRSHVRPAAADVARVEFVTANPGASAGSRFVTILAQDHPLEFSRVAIDRDPKTGAFKGTTANVAAMALTPLAAPAAGAAITVELDGAKADVKPSADGRLYLEKTAGVWRQSAPPDAARKGPARNGGFKDAFRHHVVLVYGTRGMPEENARAFNKARFDAEMFWYRGNGTLDVVADTAFDAAKMRDRNVVLYGNADTNAAWKALLAGAPIDVRTGRLRIGTREITGTDLAAYAIRPRADSPAASVGIVAWTGPAGWVAASPGQYFVSGAGFPDLLVFSADMLRTGTSGVRAIGWFGRDWDVEGGDIVWGSGAPAGK
jgi:hypothetical protein